MEKAFFEDQPKKNKNNKTMENKSSYQQQQQQKEREEVEFSHEKTVKQSGYLFQFYHRKSKIEEFGPTPLQQRCYIFAETDIEKVLAQYELIHLFNSNLYEIHQFYPQQRCIEVLDPVNVELQLPISSVESDTSAEPFSQVVVADFLQQKHNS